MSYPPGGNSNFFPPPPPKGGGKNSAFSPAVVAIIAVLGSAFLVVSYYRIFAKLCTRWQTRRDELDLESQVNGAEMDASPLPLPAHGLDEALIRKISIFVYKRGDGFTVDTDCSVCLMEFADEQELRMLPKCAHAFHVACIDTWLHTHSTCPLCRANIWPEHVMSQYPSHPPVGMYGAHMLPSERMGYTFGDGSRFNGGGGHGRSPAPTLRGLLNYEDEHQLPIWIPGSSGRGDPGEDSIRLYDSRDHGGDSSSRHHSVMLPAASASSITPAPSIRENPDSRSGAYFPGDFGPQVSSTPTASFKEQPHSRSRDRDHKWRIPARRPSFRRNPFSIVRSYSMGTSRRLVHALEFLDLEEDVLRNRQNKGAGEKLYFPHEYGITEAPDFPTNVMASPQESSPAAAGEHDNDRSAAGPSSQLKEAIRSTSNLPDSLSDPELPGAALKSSGAGKGRSLSFRSPFGLKRSLSGGRNRFSFRHASRGRVFSSSGSPTHPGT